MPPPNGTLGKGTTLGHSTTQGGTYTAFANITKQIKPPGAKVGSAETTCFGDDSEQFIPGWINGGEASFTLLYITAQTSSAFALLGTDLWFQITLPDTHTWTFQGFIDEYAPGVPMKEGITEDVKIKVTGKPIYA